MKPRIGVYGSAVTGSKHLEEVAVALGEVLSTYPVSLVTGACEGLPDIVVTAAKRKNPDLTVSGYSSFCSAQEQQRGSGATTAAYTKIYYVPIEFSQSQSLDVCRKYRNVLSTASCDGAIIISGRWGTLNEFTNLVDMGKVIGILTGTGGIADELPALFPRISKPTKSTLFFDDSPEKLVKEVVEEVKSSFLRRQESSL